MFFIGIFGIDSKQKQLREFGSVTCGHCGRLSRAELVQSYNYFHVFFIPTFRWNKHYYIKMRCCGAVYEADADYANILRNASDIDFSRLKKVSGGMGGFDDFSFFYDKCQNCGARIESDFAWCPHCGEKRRG